MINRWSVLASLKLCSSTGLSDSELLAFCEAAAMELAPRIKEEADLTDIRLINLAAARAYCKILARALSSDEGITSFKAGDVTIATGASQASDEARKARDEALRAALPLLRDEEFFFSGVSV